VCKQIYYSVRERLPVRLTALLIMLGINLLFWVLTAVTRQSFGVMVTAVVFSSLALAYLIIANILVSFISVHELFSAPKGYNVLLAPVPGWKLILGRVIPAAVIDIAMMGISIPLVVWHSLRLGGVSPTVVHQHPTFVQDVATGAAGVLLGYTFLLLIYCFFRVVSKSLLHRSSVPNLLGILLTIASVWVVSSLFNLVFIPFGRVDIWGPVVLISLFPSPMVRFMFVLVLLLQAAVFLAASARLMERRINI